MLLGVAACFGIGAFVIDFVLGQLLSPVLSQSGNPLATFVATVLSSMGSMVVAPLFPIAYTELYYDARTRLEGLDITLKAVTSPEPSPADVPSPVPTQFMQNDDFLNLALFAVGGVVVA